MDNKPRVREIDAELALAWLPRIDAPFPAKTKDGRWWVLSEEFERFHS